MMEQNALLMVFFMHVDLGINRESLDKGLVGALEPTVKWQTSGTVADFDVEVRRYPIRRKEI